MPLLTHKPYFRVGDSVQHDTFSTTGQVVAVNRDCVLRGKLVVLYEVQWHDPSVRNPLPWRDERESGKSGHLRRELLAP